MGAKTSHMTSNILKQKWVEERACWIDLLLYGYMMASPVGSLTSNRGQQSQGQIQKIWNYFKGGPELKWRESS